jgi:syntaxin of plants SYP6
LDLIKLTLNTSGINFSLWCLLRSFMSTHISAASDPYYLAKEEVDKNLFQIQQKLKTWDSLYTTASSDKFLAHHNKLLDELKHAIDDLNELENAVKAIEKNPQKFAHCTPYELDQRRNWLQKSKQTWKSVNDKITSPVVKSKIEADKRKAAADLAELERQKKLHAKENDERIDRARTTQSQIIAKQDEDLTELSQAATRLGEAAVAINYELKDQERMLNDLDHEVDRQREKMNFVMRKTAQLLKTNDSNQICLILSLTGIAILLIMINVTF